MFTPLKKHGRISNIKEERLVYTVPLAGQLSHTARRALFPESCGHRTQSRSCILRTRWLLASSCAFQPEERA